MSKTKKLLGYCETDNAAAAGNGSVAAYLDTLQPAPARFARVFSPLVTPLFLSLVLH